MPATPILLYHQIKDLPPEKNPIGMATPPQLFESQMRFLSEQGYHTLALDALLDARQRGALLPAKSVVITFDDGYLDNYEVAMPIMQQYGFTATIFLVVEQMGGMTNWEGQRDPIALMSWENVRHMRQEGFSFGSHTLTHANLKTLSETEARHELQVSRQKLEEKLGETVTTLAYPYESFRPLDLKLVEEAGYRGACGSPALAETNFNLWREECFGYTTLDQFKFKVSAWHHLWMWTRYRSPMVRGLKQLKKMIKG